MGLFFRRQYENRGRVDELGDSLAGVQYDVQKLQEQMHSIKRDIKELKSEKLDDTTTDIESGNAIDTDKLISGLHHYGESKSDEAEAEPSTKAKKLLRLKEIRERYGVKIWKQALDDMDKQGVWELDEFKATYPVIYRTDTIDPAMTIYSTFPPKVVSYDGYHYLEAYVIYARRFMPSSKCWGGNNSIIAQTPSYFYWTNILGGDGYPLMGFKFFEVTIPINSVTMEMVVDSISTKEMGDLDLISQSGDFANVCIESTQTPVDIEP